ncbi:hypothetical protein [Mycolicibacterium goodii]|uniref:Uncharacterized protein n=1 Tax=Mycolicibacterium goodii TaxID=134601 RepID=A0A0K0X3G2_MYCGD|nr:hypothetical protein AFA91_08610 [Mycolicibacterium goodii]
MTEPGVVLEPVQHRQAENLGVEPLHLCEPVGGAGDAHLRHAQIGRPPPARGRVGKRHRHVFSIP